GRVLSLLRIPETAPGQHDGYGQLAQEALADELGTLLSTADLTAWIASGSPAAKAVAARLLRLRPEAALALGLERLTALAPHEIAAGPPAAPGPARRRRNPPPPPPAPALR